MALALLPLRSCSTTLMSLAACHSRDSESKCDSMPATDAGARGASSVAESSALLTARVLLPVGNCSGCGGVVAAPACICRCSSCDCERENK